MLIPHGLLVLENDLKIAAVAAALLWVATGCKRRPLEVTPEDPCGRPGVVREFELTLGPNDDEPLVGASVTESRCGHMGRTDRGGRVAISVPVGSCFHLLVDHPDAVPAAIGLFSSDARAQGHWEIPPRSFAVPLGVSGADGVLIPRWKATDGRHDGDGIHAEVVGHPEAVATYYDRQMQPVLGANATVEGRSAYLSLGGIAGGPAVSVALTKPTMAFRVNPESVGMCEKIPVIDGRVSLFLAMLL